MACRPIVVSYPGIVPSSFPKDFCLLPDCPLYISSVQSLIHVQCFSISWGAARQSSLSITNSHSLLKLMFIKLVMPPNNFFFCLPLCLLPLIFSESGSFLMSQFLPSGDQKGHFLWIRGSARIGLEVQLQHWPFQRIFRTDFL